MLNKLLKRCTPWMDKGRWYHIKITGELINDLPKATNVKYDNSMFSRYEVDSTDPEGLIKLYFSDPSINACIIDSKTIVNANIHGESSKVIMPSDTTLDKSSDSSGPFIILYPWPGDLDVWLFIKTN